MVGLRSVFPCLSVRVLYGRWHYEQFEGKRSIQLPELTIASDTLTGEVFQNRQVITYRQSDPREAFSEILALYFSQGLTFLQIHPLTDVNEHAVGLVEVTALEETIPDYSQELLNLLVQQVGVLLEAGQPKEAKASREKRPPAPELLTRLKEYEEEIQQAREREALFYSLTRYFRDTVRLVDAWKSLQDLTPDNEISNYDFHQHSEFYFQQAYKFSELLLYSYKMQKRELQLHLNRQDILTLIHWSISEFTQYHRKTSLNIRTQFPANPVEVKVDGYLFRIAVMYALENLFLQSRHLHYNHCFAIDVADRSDTVHLKLNIERDPLMQQLTSQDFNLKEFMNQPLDEYGLLSLYLPFVKLAIAEQHGSVSEIHREQELVGIEMEFPK